MVYNLGMLITKLVRRDWGIRGYFSIKRDSVRRVSQALGLYGVRADSFLSSSAVLSSMRGGRTAQTDVAAVMTCTGAARHALPVSTDRSPISHGEDLVRTKGKGGERVVPQHGSCALDNLVGVAAKTDRTGGIDLPTCARLKVRPPARR